MNDESKLSIQIFYDEPKCFDSFMAHYGKFVNVKIYIAIVGNKNEQEKAGYYGEKIVLKCQKMGLNTCWVAMTHGKSQAKIKKRQKLLIIISLGYGNTQGVAHRGKSIEELCSADEDVPWFKTGMEAVSLAPTAMNQQKFLRPAVSHHLQILKDAGILKMRREATRNYYYFDPDMKSFELLIGILQKAIRITSELPDRSRSYES